MAARRPREKPMRDQEHEDERADICKSWTRKRADFFTDEVDLIMDNKEFPLPISKKGLRWTKMRSVRFHLRTRSEGVKKGHTKPNNKKNRVNVGGNVKVLAGISNCRVALWEYLPKGRWSGKMAVDMYKGPIIKTLRKQRGDKAQYRILEDNDPTGYKSNAAIDAKKELKIKPIPYPRYSPDLNPLDYYLWNEVQRRMLLQTPKKQESKQDYMVRLRKTAFAIPQAEIRLAVASLRKRAKAVYDAEGGDIPRD